MTTSRRRRRVAAPDSATGTAAVREHQRLELAALVSRVLGGERR